MSFVGETAAILQLVGAALELARSTSRACQGVWNAPEEFRELQEQVRNVEARLECCREAVQDIPSSGLRTSIKEDLEEALKDVNTSLQDLKTVCTEVKNIGTPKGRCNWAIRHKRKVIALKSSLKDACQSLGLAMQPALLCMSSRLLSCNRDVEKAAVTLSDMGNVIEDKLAIVVDSHKDLNRQVSTMKTYFERLSMAQVSGEGCHSGQQFIVVEGVRGQGKSLKPRPHRRLDSQPWKLSPAWALVGVSGNGIPTAQLHNQDYYVSFKILEPLTRWLIGYALHVSLNLRRFRASPLSFQFLNGTRFDICRVVSSEHSFFYACERGDLLDVRTQLASGEGRISDRDERNWTPLAYAIKGGKLDVVQELLDQHADIEGRIGKFETTPLQWAIWHKDLEATRLLLDRQASQDHINMRGWNTVFFCWSRLRNDEPCMLGFLNLLTADEQLDLDIQDERQWSVLDRVAAVGTVEELERLIELSANPHKEAMPLRWTAIHHAVFYGNFKTFNALLRRHEKAVHLTDERGWTLLHIAASAGHQDIVRRLLELGSDEQALSAAATEPELLARMPAILHGRQCTPREVAEAQGLENEQEYLLTVKEYHRANDTVEESEEFWEAQEKLEKGASGSE